MPPSTDAAEANRVKPAVDASGKQNVVGQARSGEDNEAKPYVLTGELGKGSFATVYKGYHEARTFS
jgi:serine/threonine-protein kinase ULK/ATG1